MKVCLLSAYPPGPHNIAVRWLEESAQGDLTQRHQIAAHPEEADLVLFAEHHPRDDPFFLRVATHPWVRQYREKCFLYHDADDIIPLLPGLYPSVERSWYDPARCRPAHYIAKLRENVAISTPEHGGVSRRWLFSFLGATLTHPIRKQVIALQHGRSFLKDTGRRNAWTMSAGEEQDYQVSYAHVLRSSNFILCPRGRGPSSYRLFEAMQCGRVPVIISDEWVPVPGPDWESCSLRVAEKEISSIPQLLEGREECSVRMGQQARLEWEKWFSKEVSFCRIVDQCGELLETRRTPERKARWPVLVQLLRPVHLTKVTRYLLRKQKDAGVQP